MFQASLKAFQPSVRQDEASLAEILSAFTYALDLTEGQPAGHSIRACWIATHLAEAIGLTGDALHDIFYAVLLKDLGCSVNAARVTEIFVGNDRQLKHDFKLIGPAPEDFGAFIMTKVGADVDAGTRDAAIANLMANAPAIMADIMDSRCTRGAEIARQLRFSNDTAQAIAHLDEHWDGSGLPLGIAGDTIHIGGRIALLAQVVDVFFVAGGPDAARAEIKRRSGAWLDPELCNAFLSLSASPSFWATLSAGDITDQLLALAPATRRVAVDEDYLDDIAIAFGQVIDAKSPFTGGHSARVATYTDAMAKYLGISATDRRSLARAAMLHDVGKLGVSSAIIEKPGKLDDAEWKEMRNHATLTGEILGRISAFSGMAMTAAAHHERLDGKGYPLQLDSSAISLESRIISVADFFDALTADRPYRAAMTVPQALAIMEREVGTAIDADCFAALNAILD
jgi:HD-GYP domain-containing protein (c-di-GMP phosphodiesterase class II)